ncbi:hypothetical protein D5018_14485 [Parashewanella curva]|uniref:Uncharacterized protein n=1 Tax=Parashewanella curva TaxID=2338552 RepID=A0A3L8PX06_9GAMM|nr:hypothetical protein [Parashewanella curva]RLV58978.1 hypothetical protein D5018_14485 [Parashewanella curva]
MAVECNPVTRLEAELLAYSHGLEVNLDEGSVVTLRTLVMPALYGQAQQGNSISFNVRVIQLVGEGEDVESEAFDFIAFFESPITSHVYPERKEQYVDQPMSRRVQILNQCLSKHIQGFLPQPSLPPELASFLKPDGVDVQISKLNDLFSLPCGIQNTSTSVVAFDADEVICTRVFQNDSKREFTFVEPEFLSFIAEFKKKFDEVFVMILTHATVDGFKFKVDSLASRGFTTDWCNGGVKMDASWFQDEKRPKGELLLEHLREKAIIPSQLVVIDDLSDNLRSIKSVFPENSIMVQYMSGIRKKVNNLVEHHRATHRAELTKYLGLPCFVKQYKQLLAFEVNQKVKLQIEET